jgi:PAS domain S-box-containing protein
METALILSRFDPLYGPKIILKAPETLEEELVEDIPSLMELPTKGVFIHIFGALKTANLFFKLPNPFARGMYESLLVSIITDVKSELSLILANELLQGFAQNFIKIEDAYSSFDYEPKDFKADLEKLKEIENFFFSYFETIKPAIKTLQMAEDRYQALFKAARDAIFIMNRDTGIIIDVNLEAEKLVEESKEKIVGMQALQLDLFDEGLTDPNMVKHLIDQPPPIISRVKKSTGTQLYLEVTVNEIQIGENFYIQYLFHDLSDLHVIEEKLKDHAKKIDTMNKFISIANQAIDLTDLLKKIIISIIEFLELKGCCIHLVDKTQNIAKIEAHNGLPQFFFEKNKHHDLSKAPFEIVYRRGVALVNDNFPEFIKEFFVGYESSPSAVIPLFSKFEILGSISMLFNKPTALSPEDMDLIVSIGLEIGTTIEKMQNQEDLIKSEHRNSILLNHIPFSIFRISIDGIVKDAKLDKKIEKFFELSNSSQSFVGKHLNEVLPKYIAEDAINNIVKALETNQTTEIKFSLSYKENQIILHSNIIPIGRNEVLAFLQNLTRTW